MLHGNLLNMEEKEQARILVIEPFYGGSHKQLVDLLSQKINGCVLFTLPAKKWHWRMRTSALYFAQSVPASSSFRMLFASSVLNLAELLALRPDLTSLQKILYFHENQLVYPVRKQHERDFQFGYNQIISSLVADKVLFNSKFNMDSFLNSINTFLNLMPDFRPKDIPTKIRAKSKIMYFPVTLVDDIVLQKETSQVLTDDQKRSQEGTIPLHIVWPHRWEHDKDPETFFNIMFQLSELGVTFYLSVIGQTFQDVPEIFHTAKEKLKPYIIHWGYQESRQEYLNVLKHADLVVSTATHEFFGVAMLEAVCCKCFPLCPNSLVYPEIFPRECLYNTPQQLFKKLKHFTMKPNLVRQTAVKFDITRYGWSALRQQYEELLGLPS